MIGDTNAFTAILMSAKEVNILQGEFERKIIQGLKTEMLMYLLVEHKREHEVC